MDNEESKLYLTHAMDYDKKLANEQIARYRVYFQVQMTVDSLSQLFTELNYLATSEVCVTDVNQNIIYAPTYWKTNYRTKISKIFEYPQYSGVTLETHFFPNTTIQIIKKQMELNSTEYEFEMVRVPLSGTFKSSQLSSFLNDKNIDAHEDSDTQTFIFMYGQQEEMLQIYTLISTIIEHEETVIILLTMCSCINTVAIVFIFTYMVAVKISRPLRKLINSAAHMSSSASSKNVTSKILQELDQIEAQN